MITITTFIYFISFLSNLFLGFFVFLNNRKEKINRVFFLSIILASGWLISLYFFYTLESPNLILWIGRFNFAIVLPLLYFLFVFSIIFPRKIIPISHLSLLFLGSWVLIFSFLTFFTSLVDKNEIITGIGQRKTVYGPLYPLYVFHYIIFTIAIILILFYKLRKSEEKIERYQIIYVLLGLLTSLAFGFITNILLPFFGFFEAQKYGPLATIIFSVFITLSIFRHHLFDIKVIASEVFTTFIVLMLLINIFSPSLLLNIIVFLSSLIFGIFLVKAVIKEIQAKEELIRLDQAKTEFMSMASHQLRTPLTAIKGYISLALENQYGEIPANLRKALNNVYASNERMIRLVNDLLTISRIELGKMVLDKKPTQIEELIQSVIEELKINAEKKGLKLFFETPEKPLPQLLIDSLKIRQVLMNLIDNAIRYTHQGFIKIRAEKKDSFVRISVQDTGEGLSEKEKTTIFSGFTRGKAGIAFFIEGAGLGLMIAKKFVELHQGKIWAESEGRGKGSVFIFELPLKY
jgi:signal transduction histidine kinase